MIEQGLIFQPLFSVHCKLDCGDSAGFYSFGEIDETVTPNPITHPGIAWRFLDGPINILHAHTLDGKTIEREANTAILDTSSATLFFDACAHSLRSNPP
ncbi:hypothetical protein B0H14DRAFT_3435478 [Mycena olivaceomarginata]|nr:hypothetical protein B0H14DRAFT_3435478 [Mycena olivaceomarginata]